jgi:hypothetical protein
MSMDTSNALSKAIVTTNALIRFPSYTNKDDINAEIPLVKTSESKYTHVSITIPAHDQG